MAVTIRNKKISKSAPGESKADRLARSMGGRRFKMNEAVTDPEFSDQELKDFLKWREETRKTDLEAQRNWQS